MESENESKPKTGGLKNFEGFKKPIMSRWETLHQMRNNEVKYLGEKRGSTALPKSQLLS